jgi:hypothetical protein
MRARVLLTSERKIEVSVQEKPNKQFSYLPDMTFTELKELQRAINSFVKEYEK